MSSSPVGSYPVIAEIAFCPEVPPPLMDRLWAYGWRHFGPDFFRNSLSFHQDRIYRIQPLRVAVDTFVPSKRMRKILRENEDLSVVISPTELTDADYEIFQAHKTRFAFDPPQSLHDFLGPLPGLVPCRNLSCRVYLHDRLIAVSYLDAGERAGSSVYASFDLAESHRSLGYLTMLKEIEYCQAQGWQWYYPGYAYHEPSFYDYKKRLRPYEWLDWRGGWRSDPPEECFPTVQSLNGLDQSS